MKLRIFLLILGCLLVSMKGVFDIDIAVNVQYILFFVGIFFLGIPHGSADLLVANKTSENINTEFSKLKFFFNYLSRLIIFGLVLWFFPLFGNLLFILLASYHFGETDLHQFELKSIFSKIFVCSYGFLILGSIIFMNYEEAKNILLVFESGKQNLPFLNYLGQNSNLVLVALYVIFGFISTVYFYLNKKNLRSSFVLIYIQLAVLLFILSNLSMLLGFTFYFVVWHSLWSLKNIIDFLKSGSNSVQNSLIFKQILIYSSLAMLGIAVFMGSSYLLISFDSIVGFSFLGLAVLTAPHLQIMHDMYANMKANNQFNFQKIS